MQVAPAATVMLIDDRPDLHVLMVRRNPRAVFGPGHWVFPGGRVDHDDAGHVGLLSGLSPDTAAEIPEPDPGAYWVAAIRETFEETGILLATDPTGWVDAGVAQEHRRRLLAGTPFAALVAEAGFALAAGHLHYVAQWITPPGPPRRFDTHFFIGGTPPDHDVSHDAGEVVDTRWVRPADALAGHADGSFTMMTPTRGMLRSLAGFPTAASALTLAATRPPWRRPRTLVRADGHHVVLPGDPGYDVAREDIERGRTRLVP